MLNKEITEFVADDLTVNRHRLRLSELEKDGGALAAFEAVDICSRHSWSPPGWCAALLFSALQRFRTGRVKDLNEAFDVKPTPMNKRKRMEISFNVWKFIYLKTEHYNKTHIEAIEEAKNIFNIGQRTAQRYYDSWEHSFKAFDKSEIRDLKLSGEPPILAG